MWYLCAVGARDAVASTMLPPHIYLVAANAFRRMLREGCNQSLIVNGKVVYGIPPPCLGEHFPLISSHLA